MTGNLALILSNSPVAGLYDSLLHLPVGIRIGPLALQESLLHWINDGLMAVFSDTQTTSPIAAARRAVSAALGSALCDRGERVVIVEWTIAEAIAPWFGLPPVDGRLLRGVRVAGREQPELPVRPAVPVIHHQHTGDVVQGERDGDVFEEGLLPVGLPVRPEVDDW